MKLSADMLVFRPADGSVLAVTRKDDHTAWSLPGGKVEPGESPRHAAVRETLEETNVTVWREEPLYDGPGDVAGWVAHTFVATAYDDADMRAAPDEGLVEWRPWSDILAGPFGAYYRIVLGRFEIWYLRTKHDPLGGNRDAHTASRRK